ncbi:MAG: hypothetical protein AVDCRST_MAG33-125, partial [uncultured Thermomicrobiales bacterium]
GGGTQGHRHRRCSGAGGADPRAGGTPGRAGPATRGRRVAVL